jgi:hypothetical protein
MLKFKIIDFILMSLHADINKPYLEVAGKQLIFDISFACNIQKNDEDLSTVLAFPNFIFSSSGYENIKSVNSVEKQNKTESDNSLEKKNEPSLLSIDITYFIGLKVNKSPKKKDENFEKDISERIKETLTPYFEVDLNQILTRAKYPNIYSFTIQ